MKPRFPLLILSLACSATALLPASATAQVAPSGGVAMPPAGSVLAPPPAIPAAAAAPTPGSVKLYLVNNVAKVVAAAADFEKNANTYAALIQAGGGDYAKAYAANKAECTRLIEAMRENYKAMDSFGYETVEGIVAGVPALADFDVYLDAGVPKAEASADTPAAPVTLKLSNGATIDQEGALFTYIIEPALWGTNPQWCESVDLDGDGATGARESLPRAEILVAAAVDTHQKVAELLAAGNAWQPTTGDYFAAMIAMTPTLSGYFDDWKESRYSADKSGRFTAVSRVSDMRGIMQSVAVIYAAVQPQVQAKDPALAKSIDQGFADILAFIDRVEEREKKAEGKLTVAEIDELTNQAKQKADKLVPQVEQAAAILNVKLS